VQNVGVKVEPLQNRFDCLPLFGIHGAIPCKSQHLVLAVKAIGNSDDISGALRYLEAIDGIDPCGFAEVEKILT
jgi:hypothetical protein